jgi:hypothetical protein
VAHPDSTADRGERAAALLFARSEQVRRIERELAAVQAEATRLAGALDAARETLRWSEAVAEDRRRLLQFEQQRRVGLEHELHALTRLLPGDADIAAADRLERLIAEHAAAAAPQASEKSGARLRRRLAALRGVRRVFARR